MKSFPYFKWYPGDAETDDKYSAMSDTEVGFYHRCLNRSWLNGGLPADMDELARMMRVGRKYLDRVWVRVGQCFSVSEAGRLVNPRQEEEREKALAKSDHNRRPGNANASRLNRVRVPNATRSDHDARMTVLSVSGSESLVSERFEEFWEKWPRKSGKDAAAAAWVSHVTTENEGKVLACLDRFLASGDVARGAVPFAGMTTDKPGWIASCARDNWECDWPAARDSASPDERKRRVLELAKERGIA